MPDHWRIDERPWCVLTSLCFAFTFDLLAPVCTVSRVVVTVVTCQNLTLPIFACKNASLLKSVLVFEVLVSPLLSFVLVCNICLAGKQCLVYYKADFTADRIKTISAFVWLCPVTNTGIEHDIEEDDRISWRFATSQPLSASVWPFTLIRCPLADLTL